MVKNSNIKKERSNLPPQKPLVAISSRALESELAVLKRRAPQKVAEDEAQLKHCYRPLTSFVQLDHGPHYVVEKESHL